MIFLLLSALIGARALHAALHPAAFLEHPIRLLFFWRGGMSFYGLLLLSVPVFLLYVRRYGLNGWRVADALAPGLALFITVMRVGCFLAGCCYGRTCSSTFPLAVVYPEQTGHLSAGLSLHPVQLYAAGSAFLLFCILWYWRRRQLFPGQLILFLMIYYPVSRLLLGLFRGDERATISVADVHLSLFQVLGLPILMVAFWLYTKKRNRAVMGTE
jgi:phosphatidylglycerol:prolipoprotein diacylglycerol transferase